MSVSDRRLLDQNGDSPTVYLLFAGRYDQPGNGEGALVASFTNEVEARAAFRDARLHLSDREGWAELAAVDGSMSTTLSWFGWGTRHRRGAAPPQAPAGAA